MPDPKTLSVGDVIRVTAVPKSDILAYKSGSDYLKETIEVLTWMVGKNFEIYQVDEFGKPWVQVVGYPEQYGGEHTMAIFDSESWERA